MGEVRCVVKVQTEAFKRGDNYFHGKSVRVLKRLSTHDILSEEVSAIGVEEGLDNILNLHKCEDGIYEVVLCNLSKDYETGSVDGYDLKLIPYKDEDK